MKNTQIKSIITGIILSMIFCIAVPIYAQSDKTQCTAPLNKDGEKRTFSVGAGKLSKEDKERLHNTVGLATLKVPEGETERALERRKLVQSRRQERIDYINDQYNRWLANFPNAAEEVKERFRKEVDELISNIESPPRNKEMLAMKSFDWREQGLDVGKVLDQGGCNTCWAFATIDAAASSLNKRRFEAAYEDNRFLLAKDPKGNFGDLSTGPIPTPPFIEGYPRPFVQDLLDCMPTITGNKLCDVAGWHGIAFDFMVFDRGIPVSYEGIVTDWKTREKTNFNQREYKPGEKFACNPTNGFRKGLAWDYVSSPPDKRPTVKELKEALIEHGPLVAPMVTDICLKNYRGGVFNEKNLSKVNHVVLLIGWDDNKQAWLVKNSYGEKWGEEGFGWIKYDSNNIGMFAAWIDADSSIYDQPRDNSQNSAAQIRTCADLDNAEYLIYEKIKKYYDYFEGDIVFIEISDGIITVSGRVPTQKQRKAIYKKVNKFRKKNKKCIKKIVENLSVGEPVD